MYTIKTDTVRTHYVVHILCFVCRNEQYAVFISTIVQSLAMYINVPFFILTKQRPLVVLELCHSQSLVRETGHSSVAFVF